MRTSKNLAIGAGALAVALAASACGGSDSPSKGSTGSAGSTQSSSGAAAASTKSLTVWTIEDVAERVQATKVLTSQFTAKTGIKVNLVAVAEDQFDQLITSAAAAKKLPDVIAAISLAGVRSLSGNELLNTDIAKKAVDDLGVDTFAKRSLELTQDGDKQLAVPSDGWAQLLVYRKDLFDKAGLAAPTTYDAINAAAQKLNTGGVAGITLATIPGDAFTQQSFEYMALANGCQLTNDAGDVTLETPSCVKAFDFYAGLAKNDSVSGNQDVDSTRATYFAGKAAMLVWSSFILDEMAGLRNDALPTCAQCRADKAFLAKNSGIVSAISGPDGKPAQYGEVVSWAPLKNAPAAETTKFIEYMMSDAYVGWLALAPEGKVPVRQGTKPGDTSYLTAWRGLKAGVDTKAPLSSFYSADALGAVEKSPETFSRWGLQKGQGALVGATLGELPVPAALADVINGKKDGAAAAKSAQKAVEAIKADTE